MLSASLSTYQYYVGSRQHACSRLSISEQHRLTEARRPAFMKNKILLQSHGWFLVTLSAHKVKLGGLSEQGVSYPCHTNAWEERISCSRAGDLIRLQVRNKNLSGNMSKTFPRSFTTLNATGMFTRVFWDPDSLASPPGSIPRGAQPWVVPGAGRSPASTQRQATDSALKGADSSSLLSHSGEH